MVEELLLNLDFFLSTDLVYIGLTVLVLALIALALVKILALFGRRTVEGGPRIQELTLRIVLLTLVMAVPFTVIWWIILGLIGLLGGSFIDPRACISYPVLPWLIVVVGLHELILFYPTRVISKHTHVKGISLWTITHIPGILLGAFLVYYVFVRCS